MFSRRRCATILPSLALAAAAFACEAHKDLAECAISSPDCSTSDGDATTGETAGTAGTTMGSTTAEPVPCDGPPECTDQGEGDVGPLVLPLFRGEVCYAAAARPGDAIPVRATACVHPCLSVGQFKFRHQFRCTDGACEAAAMVLHPNTVGFDCPSDVFGKFDAGLCKDAIPVDLVVGPINENGGPVTGTADLLIPFLQNSDAAAIDEDATAGAIWTMIEAYEQGADRRLPIDLADTNPAAPADCKRDGCTCVQVGF